MRRRVEGEQAKLQRVLHLLGREELVVGLVELVEDALVAVVVDEEPGELLLLEEELVGVGRDRRAKVEEGLDEANVHVGPAQLHVEDRPDYTEGYEQQDRGASGRTESFVFPEGSGDLAPAADALP